MALGVCCGLTQPCTTTWSFPPVVKLFRITKRIAVRDTNKSDFNGKI